MTFLLYPNVVQWLNKGVKYVTIARICAKYYLSSYFSSLKQDSPSSLYVPKKKKNPTNPTEHSINVKLLNQANTFTKNWSQWVGSFYMRCLNYVGNLIICLSS